MGLFDGAARHRRGLHRARRQAAGRPGGAGRRRLLEVPLGRRAGARLRDVRPARCASPASSSTGSAPTGTSRCCVSVAWPRGIPVLGVLRRDADVAVPSPAPRAGAGAERAEPRRSRPSPALGASWPTSVDLDAVVAAGPHRRPRSRRAVAAGRTRSASPVSRPAVVAVAGGAAFTFGYAETTELLDGGRRGGRRPSTRCPTSALPDRHRALVLGGGFPEVHAAQLSANAPLRASRRGDLPHGRSDRRRVRRPALPGPEPRRRADVRRARRRRRRMTPG